MLSNSFELKVIIFQVSFYTPADSQLDLNGIAYVATYM